MTLYTRKVDEGIFIQFVSVCLSIATDSTSLSITELPRGRVEQLSVRSERSRRGTPTGRRRRVRRPRDPHGGSERDVRDAQPRSVVPCRRATSHFCKIFVSSGFVG